MIGKSTVARVCLDTRERYRRWCERRLEEHDLVYLFLDALYPKLRPDDEPAEGVLVAWGVTLEGRKVTAAMSHTVCRVNLVYIISAYRLPEQLVRLVTRLRTENATVLVHIDKKASPEVFGAIWEGVRSLPDVHLLDRHVCNWGGFGHVAASLDGIAAIVENGIHCDQAVLLTGQDFPLKSNEQIKARLGREREYSFLSHFPVPDNDEWLPDGGLERIDRWYFWVRGRRLQVPSKHGRGRLGSAFTLISDVVPRRRFLPGLRPYGGSSYWCLSGDAVSFVHHYVREHPEFVSFFRRVFIPDELFFQTILVNSELRNRIVNDDLRYIRWTATGSGPEILRVDEFDRLRGTKCLFARKFDQGVDGGVLDLIEEHLL